MEYEDHKEKPFKCSIKNCVGYVLTLSVLLEGVFFFENRIQKSERFQKIIFFIKNEDQRCNLF